MLRHIERESVALVKAYNDERKFFSSQISLNMCQPFQTQSESIIDTIVPKILEQMVVCSQNCRTNEKAEAISWLLNEICKAFEIEDPGATWKPLLAGSGEEGTQAFYIDEFDYLLRTNSGLQKEEIGDVLETIVSKMKKMDYPRLALERMNLNTEGSYPCLHITWVDEHLRNTHISIDLVPSQHLDAPDTLPPHNFLSLSREERPDEGDATQRRSSQGNDTKRLDHKFVSSLSAKNGPRLFNEPRKDSIWFRPATVFSKFENALIKALPPHIIEGYRLAKAIRITHVIRPVVKKLVELGVTLDFHKVIKTYYLKTALFLLTKHYVCDDSDIEGNNRWTWAIAIYVELRKIVILGNVKEFFASERFIFKGLKNNQEEPDCVHDEDFTAPLPRFRCCRFRKARLLMVDQILRVLRQSFKHYHKSSQEKSCSSCRLRMLDY